MGKISFLVGKPGDQKFKRNVPKQLQKLAGKTAFVERVRSARISDIKEQRLSIGRASVYRILPNAQ